MNSLTLYALVGIALFSMGLHAVIVRSHLLRKILAVNIMGSGVFVLLVALARTASDTAVDPVAQAMVITGIVVSVSATALALALMLRIQACSGQTVLPEKPRN